MIRNSAGTAERRLTRKEVIEAFGGCLFGVKHFVRSRSNIRETVKQIRLRKQKGIKLCVELLDIPGRKTLCPGSFRD